MKAEQGIVTSHAMTMRVVTSHLMLVNLRVAPTPMMASVMMWVVDTGMSVFSRIHQQLTVS